MKMEFHVQISATETGYVINGIECPLLILHSGQRYVFHLEADGFPFFLTHDALGGTNRSIGEVTIPQENGTLEFTPTPDLVGKRLYYQADSNTNMGNKIRVI